MSSFICLVSVAAVLAGQSITGAWTGALVVKHEGQAHEDSLHLVLKQKDDAISGTAGPDADRQYPIKNARIAKSGDVTQLTFEMTANGVHHAFSLKLIDGVLKGEARGGGEDGREFLASVELKPVR